MGRLKTIRIVLLLTIISSAIGLSAQTHYHSNVSLGVKGGVDLSRVLFNPSVRQTFALGSTGGVMFRYIEENHFGLIAELNFAQMGWKEDFETAPYNYSRTTNYISLPILAHIYFGRRGRFFINAGAQVSVFLGESYKANFDPYNTVGLPNFPHTNRMNSQMTLDVAHKADYGIAGGLGGEFSINEKNALTLEARFYFGLSNVFPSKRADVFGASNNMSIQATLGYWFRIR